jgi:MFS family permease
LREKGREGEGHRQSMKIAIEHTSRESSRPAADADIVQTDVPSRLDALPWGRFHTLVVVALGVTWILDGLEVTLAGALSGVLKEHSTLGLTNTQIGLAGSAYLIGAFSGALYFGWLTDRLGRRRLFFITVTLYLLATAATAASWDFWSFATFRFLTGSGIGGEYTAINSTIQELVPARMRGWTDLVINGSFWLGAAVGAVGAIVLLDPATIDPALGWRLAFAIGATLGLVVFVMRLWIPESPRWLITHGREQEAEAIVVSIERQFASRGGFVKDVEHSKARLRARKSTPFGDVAKTLFQTYRQRTLVGLSLMAAQAFLFNAVFFTYALILSDFYGVRPNLVGWHLLAFAAGNFLGPVVLGRLFDTLGRRIMISVTHAISGLLIAGAAHLFSGNLLSAQTQTIVWMAVFFFASAAASSAYLTVSETFPIEIRALAIAFFYAIGVAVGGVVGPWFFAILIDTGQRAFVAGGYLLGALLMIGAALIEWLWGIAAERKPLETVSRPLTFIE